MLLDVSWYFSVVVALCLTPREDLFVILNRFLE